MSLLPQIFFPASRGAVLQALVTVAFSALALGSLLSTVFSSQTLRDATLGLPLASSGRLLVLCLLLGLGVAYRVPLPWPAPVSVRMSTVVLCLLGLLLPPALAATVAGLGTLGGELSLRLGQRGASGSLSAVPVRSTLAVLLTSLVAHASLGASPPPMALSYGAATMVCWLGEMLIASLQLAPSRQERPGRVLWTLVRDAGLVEAGLCLLGGLSAGAATHTPWMLLFLLPVMTLFAHLARCAAETQDSLRQLVESMADTVDVRDPYTTGHSRRVTTYAQGILRELDLQGAEADLIVTMARVHDIGKIGIPDTILHKPGALSADERRLMEQHPEYGADVLRRHRVFRQGVAIVRHHHEAWDGTGYPHRLQGTEIPLGARVIAVADSFDAMTSDRPYRRGMPAQRAVTLLHAGRGTQWDPQVVDAFLRSLPGQRTAPAVPSLRLLAGPDHEHEALPPRSA